MIWLTAQASKVLVIEKKSSKHNVFNIIGM